MLNAGSTFVAVGHGELGLEPAHLGFAGRPLSGHLVLVGGELQQDLHFLLLYPRCLFGRDEEHSIQPRLFICRPLHHSFHLLSNSVPFLLRRKKLKLQAADHFFRTFSIFCQGFRQPRM